ncbi:hypothetical protein HZB60_07535 [candidate division KSB1 bacterium]|nr:hypothetical protein [candidate division KSB1 bacterium]
MTTTQTQDSGMPAVRSRRRRDAGFTFVSTAITTIMAGVVLLGGWVAYRSFTMQIKVANADRQMDQYAQSTFLELTNLMGWGWDAVQIQGGSRNPIWKVRFYDRGSPGTDFARNWRYGGRLQDSLMTITYRASRGILLGGREPLWYGSGRSEQFVFTGQRPRHDEIATMGRYDRITVEGFTMDYVRPSHDLNLRKLGSVDISMTLQYRYRPPGRGDGLFGLFEQEYVRERTYQTSVFMRNWDTSVNPQADEVLGRNP